MRGASTKEASRHTCLFCFSPRLGARMLAKLWEEPATLRPTGANAVGGDRKAEPSARMNTHPAWSHTPHGCREQTEGARTRPERSGGARRRPTRRKSERRICPSHQRKHGAIQTRRRAGDRREQAKRSRRAAERPEVRGSGAPKQEHPNSQLPRAAKRRGGCLIPA